MTTTRNPIKGTPEMTNTPNPHFLTVRCDRHHRPLVAGLVPELGTVDADEAIFEVKLFPAMFCPSMWDGDEELANEICWGNWSVTVEGK